MQGETAAKVKWPTTPESPPQCLVESSQPHATKQNRARGVMDKYGIIICWSNTVQAYVPEVPELPMYGTRHCTGKRSAEHE